jgi:hypothetical protein
MEISVEGHQLEFVPVPIRFRKHGIGNVFAARNDKTLGETLLVRRYANMSDDVHNRYASSLDDKLGKFLHRLKTSNDDFYKRFLNRHGDDEFCDFSIERTSLSLRKGLYCFVIGGEVKYVGRSHDPFKKRFNQEYGHISPQSCYLDGQSTNCHINALIAMNHAVVALFVCPMESDLEIDRLERLLIDSHQPEWNIQLRRSV